MSSSCSLSSQRARVALYECFPLPRNKSLTAAELRTALLVDPTNERALTDAYIAALTMLPAERRVRMRHLRMTVARHDVYQWAERVLEIFACDARAGMHASNA